MNRRRCGCWAVMLTGLAPRPIAAALDDRPPHLTMSRLPGRPVTVADLTGRASF